eukprot:8634649-Pyramimonas_sp.AAC.1
MCDSHLFNAQGVQHDIGLAVCANQTFLGPLMATIHWGTMLRNSLRASRVPWVSWVSIASAVEGVTFPYHKSMDVLGSQGWVSC